MPWGNPSIFHKDQEFIMVKLLTEPSRYIQGYCIMKDFGQSFKFAEESEPGDVKDMLQGAIITPPHPFNKGELK